MARGEMKKTFEEWKKYLHILCKMNSDDIPLMRKFTRKQFFVQMTLMKVFHVYRANNIDTCTCAYAQYYRDRTPPRHDVSKYSKTYRVALPSKVRH